MAKTQDNDGSDAPPSREATEQHAPTIENKPEGSPELVDPLRGEVRGQVQQGLTSEAAQQKSSPMEEYLHALKATPGLWSGIGWECVHMDIREWMRPAAEEVFDTLFERVKELEQFGGADEWRAGICRMIGEVISQLLVCSFPYGNADHCNNPECLIAAARYINKYGIQPSETMKAKAQAAFIDFAREHPAYAGGVLRAFASSTKEIRDLAIACAGMPAFHAMRAQGVTDLPDDDPAVRALVRTYITNHCFWRPYAEISQLQAEYSVPDEEFRGAVRDGLVAMLDTDHPLSEWIAKQEEYGEYFDKYDPAVQAMLVPRFMRFLLWRNEGESSDGARLMREMFSFRPAEYPLIVAEVQNIIHQDIKVGRLSTAEAAREMAEIPDALLEDAVRKGVSDLLDGGNFFIVQEALQRFPLSSESIALLWKGKLHDVWKLTEWVGDDVRGKTLIQQYLGLGMPVAVLHEAGRDAIRGFLGRCDYADAERVSHWASLEGEFPGPSWVPIALAGAAKHLLSPSCSVWEEERVGEQLKKMGKGWEDLRGQIVALDGLLTLSQADSLSSFVAFQRAESHLAALASRNKNTPIALTIADLPAVRRLHLRLVEAEEIKRADPQIAFEELTAEQIVDLLIQYCEQWEDQDNVSYPFQDGIGVFGAERMLQYLDRPGLSRHDGLHAFRAILQMQRASRLSPSAFFQNILAQVSRSGVTYSEGTAHHHLNTIAQNVRLEEMEQVLAFAKNFTGIQKLQILLEGLRRPEDVCASWQNLQRYTELLELLQKKDILDQLQELHREPGKEKLRHFIETLCFHPSSKVNIPAVMEFWRHPEAFFDRNETHAVEAHNRKKPSNYLHIPFLDLTAEQLRDALVEGAIDRLQVFPPLEIQYSLPRDGRVRTVREALDLALGSRRENRAPKAMNQRKLFGAVAAKLKEECTVQEYLRGAAVPPALEEQISELVYDEQMGMDRPEERRFVAKMNLKSDPDGILAGDDTACCMPFGSGKKVVYDYNPNTTQFTLQLETGDGTWRTIAQSVMTKDTDIGKPVPEVLRVISAGERKMDAILPEKILQASDRIPAADNVEVAQNYRDMGQMIALLYKDFFNEYLRRFGRQQGFRTERIIIGKGYSDALTHLPEVPNTFVPDAPVGYSDKTHETVYALNTSKNVPGVAREIREIPLPAAGNLTPTLTVRGVSPLTFSDTLRVSYLEGKLYSDNASLMVYLHNIENALIGIAINNTMKDRPNLSLKHEENGRITGYLLAYEGAVREEDCSDEPELRTHTGQRVIYIADLASDPKKNPLGGWKLIQGLLSLYRTEYLERGNAIPIFLQAREGTSYRFFSEGHFQKQVEKLGKELRQKGFNIDFRIRELPVYTEGGERMHPLIVEPVVS